MHHWQKSHLGYTLEGAYFYKKRELYLTNLKDFWRQLGLHPHKEGTPFLIENLYEPCVTFSGIKENNYDSSTFVNISLHLSSDSTTLVYICLWLVYISLHSSSDSSVFLK